MHSGENKKDDWQATKPTAGAAKKQRKEGSMDTSQILHSR